LAAPQVGVLRRVVLVLELDEEGKEKQLYEMINPVIVESSGEQYGTEGCLSVPGVYGYVKRPMKVKVRAQDRYGNYYEAEGEGLTARAFCHELDHLDGHLYTEFADKIYREGEEEDSGEE
ncbi:MAG: peptide deformylase, partial [Oscillospiraceae bacterium]|nr:peptide deformylase [Oscillospiraceae bacterium]